jgi:hypothetical protein
MTKTLVARWETRGKRYWYELYHDELGFTYTGRDCGGNLGTLGIECALARMGELIASDKLDGINLKRVR